MVSTGNFKVKSDGSVSVDSPDGIGNIALSRNAASQMMSHNSRSVAQEPDSSSYYYRVLSLTEEKAQEFWHMAEAMRDFIDKYAKANTPGPVVLAIQTVFRQIEV